MTLDRFYPIFDSADWIARMLPLGIRLVQLRIKDRPEPELRAEIRRARDLCAASACTLIVNDHWRLAIRAAGMRLGVSTHDGAELAAALAARPDYVALGPIHPTILKAMKWAPQGVARLTEWKARIGDLPLVAIGGFTPARAAPAFAAGADIVSAVTDITLNPDPEGRVRAWIAATRAPAI